MAAVRMSELMPFTSYQMVYVDSDITSNPENISFSDVEWMLNNEIAENDDTYCDFWDAHIREGGRRFCLYVFCLLLYFYDRNSDDNVRFVSKLMRSWKIDESIYYEMQEIAETYKALYKDSAGGLSPQYVGDLKAALKTSVQTLIKFG